jgi:pimeloyl-ACP methyl ester carboxylesterase
MRRALRRSAAIAVFSALLVIGAGVPAAGAAYDPPPPGANDFSCKPSAAHPRPVVLVHGLGATMSENWSYHSPQIKAAGYCVFALTYGVDPRTALLPTAPGGVVAMERSAPELEAFVDRVLAATGAGKVDIVGHSEGTVMPRYYLERLGGKSKVKRFVALTPLWRGTEVAGTAFLRDFAAPFGLSDPIINLVASFCGSCSEFLRGSAYLNDLNADGEAIPGIVHTNIATRYDELVVPYTSGIMSDGGTNIVLQDICPANVDEHVALAFDPVVTHLILNALDPGHATAVRC